MEVALILFGSLFISLALKLPIAVAIGSATIITARYIGLPMSAVVSRTYAAVNSFPLLAIPFFMLAGALMQEGGMSRRLVRLAKAIVGTLPGALAHVQVVASTFFAALSGSSPATTAAIGSVMIPEMRKEGYPRDFSAAIQSVSGTIGTIIPPSIPMIIFGVVAGQSIGVLFAAGIVPGILKAIGIMIFVGIVSKKKGYGYDPDTSFSFEEAWIAFKESIFALLVPIIILGGIYSGVFTATEAGAIAVLYGFVVGLFIYKELKIENLMNVFANAVNTTCLVLLIVAASGAFSWLITFRGIAAIVGDLIAVLPGGRIVFLLVSISVLLFMGCFIEAVANVLIFTPIFLPIAIDFGINPIHFGIITVVFLSTGMSTPPLGENLYIAAAIADISFEKVVKRVVAPILVVIAIDLLVAFIPGLSLWLPSLLF